MGRGILILVGVGAIFAYFVTNFVHNIEEEDPNVYGVDENNAKKYAKYYSKDAIGDLVLDPSSISIETAKKVWASSPIKNDILDLFPKFDLIKDSIKSRLKNSEFKSYLLKKIGEIEDSFLAGEIDSDKAKKMIENP